MVPRSSFVLNGEIEKAVRHRVQDYALGAEPRPSGTLRVDPHVEHLLDRRGNRAGDGDVDELHCDFSCFAAKKGFRGSIAAPPVFRSSRSQRVQHRLAIFGDNRELCAGRRVGFSPSLLPFL
jgi:hypothetical protein